MLLLGYVFDYLPENEVWEQERCRLASGTRLAGHALVLQCRGDWPFLKQLLLGDSLERSGVKLLRGFTLLCWCNFFLHVTLCKVRFSFPSYNEKRGMCWKCKACNNEEDES